MKQDSTVAILGLGNIGQALAFNLSKSSHSFIAADRNLDKAKALSANWGRAAHACDIETAVKEADMIILSIPFEAIAGFLKKYAAKLENKVIVDPSNPIAADQKGGFKKVIGQNESAGETNASFLPNGATLVKALGTLGVASLTAAAFQTPEKAVLFYASYGTAANDKVEGLIKALGFDAVRVGGIDQSIRIEVFGDLHEFGALGKVVKLAEAKAML